ncbi:LAETG motif-containing sortase-dependent surface protein [Streptomyces sp. SCSIO 75703]|uniref:LAETG motif-containing sortase-dependent surface protein n=1 Tax=unclassified Streptomyces TaxID=2593676 RepID=UPI001F4772E3|nr:MULTISPECIES: LAETG motif-containing sortase-dependent surface protein [unclassified Streptomyces]
MATAAAAAVIAPAALLAAPAAYATGDTTPAPAATSDSTEPTEQDPAGNTETETPAPGASDTTEPAPEDTASTGPGENEEGTEEETPAPGATETTPTAPAPSTSAPEEEEPEYPETGICEDSKVDMDISGLPGKIVAGSGWHKFSLNVANNSDSTLEELVYLAGASSDADGDDLFRSRQVRLQAWNPDAKVWEDLDEDGYAVGFVGQTPTLEPGYEVSIPMRVDVRPGAPVGAGFTLGATIYGDAEGDCLGFGDVSYKFRIVAPGTDTTGSKPQLGGKAPVSQQKPAATTPVVTGTLAETGSSSALPTIALAGGLAVAVGGGAMFVVRRRKAGVAA